MRERSPKSQVFRGRCSTTAQPSAVSRQRSFTALQVSPQFVSIRRVTPIAFQYSHTITDYLPIFFQACLGASPIRSGVDMLATALVIAPFALLGGVMVQVQGKYRPANYIGWVITIIGFGLLTLLKADSSTGKWVGYQVVTAAGTGMIVSDHVHMTARHTDLTRYFDHSTLAPSSLSWPLCP